MERSRNTSFAYYKNVSFFETDLIIVRGHVDAICRHCPCKRKQNSIPNTHDFSKVKKMVQELLQRSTIMVKWLMNSHSKNVKMNESYQYFLVVSQFIWVSLLCIASAKNESWYWIKKLQTAIIPLSHRSTYIKSRKINKRFDILSDALSHIKIIEKFPNEAFNFFFLKICFHLFSLIHENIYYLSAEYRQFNSRWSLDIDTIWT